MGLPFVKDFWADKALFWDSKKGKWKTWAWVPKNASTFVFAYRKADEKGEIVIKPEWESIKQSATSVFDKKLAEKKEQ
jgi:hypothetical protein